MNKKWQIKNHKHAAKAKEDGTENKSDVSRTDQRQLSLKRAEEKEKGKRQQKQKQPQNPPALQNRRREEFQPRLNYNQISSISTYVPGKEE